MNLGTRLNNWLNIEYAPANKWLGMTGVSGKFVIFDTVEHGLRAGIKTLESYLREGHDTVSKMITRYAPSSENDTAAYIQRVSQWSQIGPDSLVTVADIPKIIVAMAREETGNIVNQEQIDEAMKEAS